MIGAIPNQLKLDREPQCCECQRTRIITYADGNAPYAANTTVTIKPTVGTVSTIMDTDTGYFMGDLEIYNANYCVDYANWPPCGALNTTINTLTIKNQGTTLEQIENYNIVANLFATQKGAFDEKSTWYFSAKLAQGYSEQYHQNYVKPPMVDRNGQIMFGMNQFGLGFDATQSRKTAYANSWQDNVATPFGAMGVVQDNHRSIVLQSTLGAVDANVNIAMPPVANSASLAVWPFVGAPPNAAPSWTIPTSFSGSYVSASGTTCMDWPDLYTPSQSEIVWAYAREYGSINKPMITEDLCNVRCFPIGMAPALNAYGTAAYGSIPANLASQSTSSATTAITALTGTTNYINGAIRVPHSYRVCCRPISGIIGELNDHWLFTMLMTNGQFSLQLKLEENQIALWLSSDPCRRLKGTVRDYIKNTGTRNGGVYGTTTYTLTATTGGAGAGYYQYLTTNYAPGYYPWLSVPLGVEQTAGVDAENYEAQINSIFGNPAVEGRAIAQNACTAAQYAALGGSLAATSIAPQGALAQGYPSCPQYLLVHRPWVYASITAGGGSIRQYFANETQMFYGTYLKSSVPQTKGIMDLRYDGVPTDQNQSGQIALTRYVYNSFAWVCDNIAFPAAVTAAVVEAARSDRFIVDTLTVKAQQLTVANAISQSITINVTALEARKMYVIFQNQRQYNNVTSVFYNSLCGLNPFAAISAQGVAATTTNGCRFNASQFTTDAALATSVTPVALQTDLTGVGYTLPPSYTPTNADSTSISSFAVQMTIGATNYPLQELTTIPEIIAELMKCRERFDDMFYSPNIYATSSAIRTNTGVTSYSSTTGSVNGNFYNCLDSDTFVTAFVPYELWDDQRITANYDFAPLASYTTGAAYNTNAAAVAGVCASGTQPATVANSSASTSINGYNWLAPRGFCATGVFMHPVSNFMLGFNFAAINMDSGLNSWTYLGTQTITLKLRGAVGLNVTGENYVGWAVILQNARYKYGINGNMTFVTG